MVNPEAQPFWVRNNPNIGPTPDQTPQQPAAVDTTPRSKAEAKKLQEAQFYSHIYHWILADSHVIVERVPLPMDSGAETVRAVKTEEAARIAAADQRAAEIAASPYMNPHGWRQRRAWRKAPELSKRLHKTGGTVKAEARTRESFDRMRYHGHRRWVAVTETDRKAYTNWLMGEVHAGRMTEFEARQRAHDRPHPSEPGEAKFRHRLVTPEERETPSQPTDKERIALYEFGRALKKANKLGRRSARAEAERMRLRAPFEQQQQNEPQVDWATAADPARIEAFRPMFWQRVTEWQTNLLTDARNRGVNLTLDQAAQQARERTMRDLLPWYLGLYGQGDYDRLTDQHREQFNTLFGFTTPNDATDA